MDRVTPLRRAHAVSLALVLLFGCDKASFVPADAGSGPGAQLPPPPDPSTDGTSGAARVFVLRDVILRQGAGVWRTLGYNLDDRCSSPPEDVDGGTGDPDASVPDAGMYAGWDIECAPTNMADAPSSDGDECRDNNYGQFLSLGFEALGLDLEAQARVNMEAGEFAFMVRVSEYDGDGDDPQVRAEIVTTVYGFPDGGARGDPLAWDGSDTFVPSEQSFGLGGDPVILDPTAYVFEDMLVVRIPPRADFRFTSTDKTLSVRLTDATLTARIEGDRLREAVVSGRWPVADFFDQFDGLGLCEGDSLRTIVETAVRGSADVLANPDAIPATLVPCDAVSFAIGFEGYPGIWAETPEPEDSIPSSCPPPP
jgi:hypothetical protein